MLILALLLGTAGSIGALSIPSSALFAVSSTAITLIAGGTAALHPQTVLVVTSGLTLPIIGLSAYGIPSDLIGVLFLAYAAIAGITLMILGLSTTGCGGSVLTFVWTLVAVALVSGIPINAVNVSKSITLSFSDGFDVIPISVAYVAVAFLVFESVGSIGQSAKRIAPSPFQTSPG